MSREKAGGESGVRAGAVRLARRGPNSLIVNRIVGVPTPHRPSSRRNRNGSLHSGRIVYSGQIVAVRPGREPGMPTGHVIGL